MANEQIDRISRWVRENMLSDGGAHDWFHVERVTTTALALARHEGGDATLVALCALTHDISDYKLNGGDRVKAAEMARARLTSEGFPQSDVEFVAAFNEQSGFSRRKSQDRTGWPIEWKVVQDADYLDAIGAVGMARVFWFGGFRGEAIHDTNNLPSIEEWGSTIVARKTVLAHVQEKLLLLSSLMLTASARRMADERHRRMVRFLNELVVEWNSTDAPKPNDLREIG